MIPTQSFAEIIDIATAQDSGLPERLIKELRAAEAATDRDVELAGVRFQRLRDDLLAREAMLERRSEAEKSVERYVVYRIRRLAD